MPGGAQSDEAPLLQALADDFKQSNYSFPALVQKVVSLPGYARSR